MAPTGSVAVGWDDDSGPSPSTGAAGAAVLIVVRDGPQGSETLLIQRTQDSADPASGQVSLPGGRVAATDPDLRATALREFTEEVGLSLDDLVAPPSFVTIAPAPIFRMDVGVFAGRLRNGAAAPRPMSPEEVAGVFWLPVAQLGAVSRIFWESRGARREVDAVVFQGHVLWGFTLRVLREYFDRMRTPAPGSGAPGRG